MIFFFYLLGLLHILVRQLFQLNFSHPTVQIQCLFVLAFVCDNIAIYHVYVYIYIRGNDYDVNGKQFNCTL